MSNTKVCTECSLEKPLDEYHKASKEKDGHTYACKECAKARAREYYQKNKGRLQKKARKYRSDNLEARLEYNREYQQKNRESLNAQNREYYYKNRERCLETAREWKKNNRDKCSAHDAKRRAAKLHADVPWADQEKIDYVYYCRDVINKVYGGNCEVDHILPLQGKHVCGLHVHNNLQLLSAKANRSKGAREI